jgi:AraC-like DNA-binding protein
MREIRTGLLFRNDASTPLGRLLAAGYIRESTGVPGPGYRTLGSYALVYLLRGGGTFRDERQYQRRVRAGDSMLLFPEIGHQYGPDEGQEWSEFYVIFDGPAFDLWREAGLLSPAHPIAHAQPVEHWLGRLEATLPPTARTPAGRALEISRFLAVLGDMLAAPSAGAAVAAEPPWLARACDRLAADLGAPLDPAVIAVDLGLPYETFRKRFQRHMGVSPVRYRTIRRIDAACALLLAPEQTIASIAVALGFSDEYHFSRRFKQVTGLPPREFRRRLPQHG